MCDAASPAPLDRTKRHELSVIAFPDTLNKLMSASLVPEYARNRWQAERCPGHALKRALIPSIGALFSGRLASGCDGYNPDTVRFIQRSRPIRI
jgi:hypothetical protein